MKKIIEYRVAKISSVSILSTVLSIIFQLISVPVCLHYWGKEIYGEWLTLLSFVLLLRSFESGFTSYIGNKLNLYYHQNNNLVQKHLSSAIFGILIIIIIQFILISAIILFCNSNVDYIFSDLKVVSTSSLPLFSMMLFWILTGSYSSILHKLLIPAGLMYEAILWAIVLQITNFLAIVCSAIMGLDLLKSSIVFGLSQGIIYVGSAIYIKNKIPNFYPWYKKFNLKVGYKDLIESTSLTFSGLLNQGITNAPPLIISLISGPSTLPIYTTIRTFSNLWVNVANIFSAPVMPEIIRYHANEEGDKILIVMEAYWVIVGSLLCWGMFLAYPFLPNIFNYWTSKSIEFSNLLLVLFLSSILLANLSSLFLLYIYGINKTKYYLILSFLKTSIFIGVGFFTYDNLGIISFGVGSISSELIVLFVAFLLTLNLDIFKKKNIFPYKVFYITFLNILIVSLFFIMHSFQLINFQYGYTITLFLLLILSIYCFYNLGDGIKNRFYKIIRMIRK